MDKHRERKIIRCEVKERRENTHAVKRKICIIIAIAHDSGIKHFTLPVPNSICPARKWAKRQRKGEKKRTKCIESNFHLIFIAALLSRNLRSLTNAHPHCLPFQLSPSLRSLMALTPSRRDPIATKSTESSRECWKEFSFGLLFCLKVSICVSLK